MKNYVQEGTVLTVVAPADVVSGQLVTVGSIVGVAAYDAKSGTEVEVRVEGVFSLPKTPGDAVAAGAPVKATAGGVIDGAATAVVGYAVAAAGSGTSVVNVRLVPSAG